MLMTNMPAAQHPIARPGSASKLTAKGGFMTNFKQWVLVGGLGWVLTVVALTGCSYHKAKVARETGRTENQVTSDKATTGRVEDTLKRDPAYKFPQVKVQTYQGIVQ